MVKISDRSPLTTPADADELVIVDKSDTTESADGSTKKITYANLVTALAPAVPEGGFAVYATTDPAVAAANPEHVWLIIEGDAAPPAVPTSLAVFPADGQVTLTWTDPADLDLDAIGVYVDGVLTQTIDAGTETATLTGLTNETEYSFTVDAVDVFGNRSVQTSAVLATPSDTYTVPGAPTSLGGTAGEGQVVLTWTAPVDDGNYDITDYVVEVSVHDANTWSTFADGVSATTGATVTDLTGGTEYDFRVSAVNYLGTGAASSVFSATPTAPAPLDPMTIATWSVACWAEDPSWTDPGDGNAVSSWRNGGTTATALTQGTGSRQPLYDADGFASLPAIVADGVDDYLTAAFTAIAQPTTIVVLGRFSSIASNRTLVAGRQGGTGSQRVASAGSKWRLYAGGSVVDDGTSNTNDNLFVAYYDGISSTLTVNGTQVVAGNPGTWALDGINLFTSEGLTQYGAGAIAFVAVKAGALTSGELDDVKDFARDHYGLTIA